MLAENEESCWRWEKNKVQQALENNWVEFIKKTICGLPMKKFINLKAVKDLKAKVVFEMEEVDRWKRAIITQHDTKEKAKLEYLTPAEREVWQKYFETLTQKNSWKTFCLL